MLNKSLDNIKDNGAERKQKRRRRGQAWRSALREESCQICSIRSSVKGSLSIPGRLKVAVLSDFPLSFVISSSHVCHRKRIDAKNPTRLF